MSKLEKGHVLAVGGSRGFGIHFQAVVPTLPSESEYEHGVGFGLSGAKGIQSLDV